MIARMRPFALAAACAAAFAADALAQSGAPPRRGGIGEFGSASNDKPINVEADRLEVFQREGRAVYTGNVIAVQGDTTIKCTQLVVFFDQNRAGLGATASAGSSNDSLKKLDCRGPVTVVAKSEGKSQVATGDNAVYDRLASVVTISGNVKLAEGGNVTECSSFVYNTMSGQANCTAPPGGRVRGIFVPGADDKPKARTN